MKKLTIDEIAEMAYVSRSVVSRVLNDHPNVSDEARERVKKVIKKHNYRPNSVARSLATDRTFEICVLAPRWRWNILADGYWPVLHSGIFERCMERGYFASLSTVSEKLDPALNDRVLSDRRFDGYIVIAQEVTEQVMVALRAREVPIVLIGHEPRYRELHSLDVDNEQGAYLAGKHLRTLDYQPVGVILGDARLTESQERRGGLMKAFEDEGIAIDDRWVAYGPYSQQHGHAVMTQWIDAGTYPRAIFCGSDTIAMGVLLATYRAGLRVPDDVAVVGFDDLPMSQYLTPPLTTVHQPIYKKGVMAADILIDEIEGKQQRDGRQRYLKAELVVRESCGAATRD